RPRANVESNCQCRHELEVGLGDAVEFRRQLGGTRWRRSERIELHGEVSVLTNGIDERRSAGNLAKVSGTRRNRRRGLVDAAELFGEAEELAPGLVDRRG